MDDPRLERVIQMVRDEINESPNQEQAKFKGVVVKSKKHTQMVLDSLDQESRVAALTADYEFVFTDKIDQLVQEGTSESKESAKAIALEWCSYVGLPLRFEQDDPEEGLDWVTTEYIEKMYKQKRNISILFNDENDEQLRGDSE